MHTEKHGWGGERGGLGGDGDDLSGCQAREKREDPGHQRQRLAELCAARRKHDDRDSKFGRVLLEAQVAVSGEENVELILGQGEEFPVLDAAPAHFLHGNAIMPDQ